MEQTWETVPSESDISHSEKYFELGEKFLKHQDHEAAIHCFSEAIKCNPLYQNAYLKRAETYGYADSRALQDYNEILNLNSTCKQAFMERGITLCTLGSYDAAIKDYTRVIEIDPTDPNGYIYRAIAHETQGDFHNAIKDYSDAIERNPHNLADVYNGRGNAYAQLGIYKCAIVDLNKELEINPQKKRDDLERIIELQKSGEFSLFKPNDDSKLEEEKSIENQVIENNVMNDTEIISSLQK